MLLAMHTSRLCAPFASANASTSTWTSGETVAQLTKIFPSAARSKLSPTLAVDFTHRRIVRDGGDDDVGFFRDLREGLRAATAQILGEILGHISSYVINGRNRVTIIPQVPRHVRAHPPHAHEPYPFSCCCHCLPPNYFEARALEPVPRLVLSAAVTPSATCVARSSLPVRLA